MLRVGSVAALAATASGMIIVQARYHVPETGQWVQVFRPLATLSWLAAMLLVADVLIGWARRDVSGDPAGFEAPPPPPAETPATAGESAADASPPSRPSHVPSVNLLKDDEPDAAED